MASCSNVFRPRKSSHGTSKRSSFRSRASTLNFSRSLFSPLYRASARSLAIRAAQGRLSWQLLSVGRCRSLFPFLDRDAECRDVVALPLAPVGFAQAGPHGLTHVLERHNEPGFLLRIRAGAMQEIIEEGRAWRQTRPWRGVAGGGSPRKIRSG